MVSKEFETDVYTDTEYDDIPSRVRFRIDEETAQRIRDLARLVVERNLHKIECFCSQVDWKELNHEEGGSASVDHVGWREVETDPNRLNVTCDEFWFAAYFTHTNVEVSSAGIPIAGHKPRGDAESA